MKRGILCILITGILLLAGCGKAADPEAVTDRAAQIAQMLRESKFSEVIAQGDAAFQAALPEYQLQQAWCQTALTLGEYREIADTSITSQGGDTQTVVTLGYEKGGLALTLGFNEEMQLTGLWVKPADVQLAVATPAPLPAGIQEEEVTFAADPDLPLSGTLTLPQEQEKPLPAVVLVHGSGQSDRDEAIGPNKPFRDIAHALAAQGIAVLRYDKRYYTYPEEGTALGSDLTLREEVLDDVAAAVQLLRADERIAPTQVFVLGHSMGGMLLPAILAEDPDLAGGISMAGSLRPLWEISYDQNQELAETIAPQLNKQQAAVLEQQMQQVESDITVLRSLSASMLGNSETLLGIPVGYWRSVEEYRGDRWIDKVTQPLLVLQGEEDFQVFPDTDYPLWQQALEGRDNARCVLYPGLNHLMMQSSGRRDTGDYQFPSTVDAQVTADIADFVWKNVA